MNLINMTFQGQGFAELSSWVWLMIAVALILWLWSIVVVAKEKTEDPYDRIVWLLIVLALNFVGTLLYFFFGGDAKRDDVQARGKEADLKRRANEGTL